jgi:hypothetical protein
MIEGENKTKKSFWKTPVGVLVAIFFFPFFLTYWVYKQKWDTKLKWGLIGGFWLLVFISMASNSSYKRGFEAAQNTTPNTQTVSNQTTTQAPTQAISQIPTASIQKSSPTPAVTYPPYNKTLGNNYFASLYAQKFMDTANKAAPGAVEDMYLELSPEDPKGKTESAYKQSISSAFLTVQVSSSMWDSTSESGKKDLVAAFTNSVKNTFSGFPHIKISNGVRTVAEGEWSVWNGEPKITIK